MPRCTRRSDLEIHLKGRDNGIGLDNAVVLCRKCREAAGTNAGPETDLPEFDSYTAYKAQVRAGYQCECMRTGCSHEGPRTESCSSAHGR